MKAYELHSMDLLWCYATPREDVKHTHSLNCDMQANMRKIDHLHCTSVLAVYDSSNARAMGLVVRVEKENLPRNPRWIHSWLSSPKCPEHRTKWWVHVENLSAEEVRTKVLSLHRRK